MRPELPLFLALSAALLGSCSTLCKGPGCEASYDASRLAVLLWSPDRPRTVDAWVDADNVLRGTELEGADWSIAPGPAGTVWIGLPDANRVIRVDPLSAKPRLISQLTLEGTGRFGASIASLDLDGDGARELVVGAPDWQLGAGAVYVFSGVGPSRTGLAGANQADIRIEGSSAADHLGTKVVACADLTGDGLPELALTAPWLRTRPEDPLLIPEVAGGIFMVLSEQLLSVDDPSDPWALGPTWYGVERGDSAGRAVACSDDLTGDRRADVAIGAPFAGNGVVYLIETDGNAAEAGLPSLPGSGRLDLVSTTGITSPLSDAWFGASLATVELDRESPMDLVVGAPGAHLGAGQVEVFRGSELFAGDPVPWRVIRNQGSRVEPDHFGTVLRARDVDGDGSEDLMVGVPDWYGGGNAYDAGRLFIWSGGVAGNWPPTFTVDSATWTLEGTEPFQRVGRQVEAIDLDGDGLRDLLLPTRSTAPASR